MFAEIMATDYHRLRAMIGPGNEKASAMYYVNLRFGATRRVGRAVLRLASAPAIVCGVRHVAEAADKPSAPAGWKLTWSDEFDKPEIDKSKWDFDRGNGFQSPDSKDWISGWGNGEL